MATTRWTNISDVSVDQQFNSDRSKKATLFLDSPPLFAATPWVVAVAMRNPSTNRMVAVGGSVHESFDSAQRAFEATLATTIEEDKRIAQAQEADLQAWVNSPEGQAHAAHVEQLFPTQA